MKSFNALLIAAASVFVSAAAAQEPLTPSPTTEPTKATFLMTGLHCPPCTRTVESSLQRAKGIRSVKVDWKTKTARVEFDETELTAQAIAQLIATTPHMMGSSLHYAGWLALKVPNVKDAASGQQAEKALLAVEGVKSAKAYLNQHIIAANFGPNGDVTTTELLSALKAAGMAAETY
jgi:copper chaperone CopZ